MQCGGSHGRLPAGRGRAGRRHRGGAAPPGERLPPQRAFARRRGIAGSTANRVYRELARRGLVVGEVGRGTFVRAGEHPPGPALAEPADARVDLELNHPVVPGQSALLAEGLERLRRPDVLDAALGPAGVAGTAAAREAAAALLASRACGPTPPRCCSRGTAGRPSREPWRRSCPRAAGSASRRSPIR
ncbi:GntR family transcriptional regulator [Actinomadura luteofluorescens]|uniref:GntR family transcriptional regulator n=1 Tax=Actinomadura luteofluorescens TaxID=46163 RepID=UPI0036369C8D